MYWKMLKGWPKMLTAKQENFVELLTQGTSQSSAYKGLEFIRLQFDIRDF